MFFQINGFFISNLQKASDDKLIKVDIIANHLTEDDEGETILKEAFNKATVDRFLETGLINFWHDNKNPLLTKQEKNAAVIGRPIAFRWEKGKPVVTAELTSGHPRVEEMRPHLEANNPVYAASVDGGKMVMLVKDTEGNQRRIIPQINWDGLAIAPRNQVINREPGVNIRLLAKANDIIADFNDIDSFSMMSGNIVSRETELRKALGAPESVSDMYGTPGGVITKQDLGKTIASSALNFSEDEALKLIGLILDIKSGALPPLKEALYDRYDEEFAGKSYRLFDKFFKK